MPVREELHRITMGLPKKKSNNHHQRQGHRQRRPETVNSLCVVIHIHIQYLNSFVCVSMIIRSYGHTSSIINKQFFFQTSALQRHFG